MPWRAQAASTAARGATEPSEDCTAEAATRVVEPSTCSASSSSGASTTLTPRTDWARKGNVTLVNSPRGTSTEPPSGTVAATSATRGDTWAPMATVEAGTCTSRPNASRARVITASYSGGCAVPRRHSSRAAPIATRVCRGGSPNVAVLRYGPSASNSAAQGHGVVTTPP
jgi:hypothetical protein